MIDIEAIRNDIENAKIGCEQPVKNGMGYALQIMEKHIREKNGTIFEEARYRSVDQTGETYDDGEAWRCISCCNVWKKEWTSRFVYCPACGRLINTYIHRKVRDKGGKR